MPHLSEFCNESEKRAHWCKQQNCSWEAVRGPFVSSDRTVSEGQETQHILFNSLRKPGWSSLFVFIVIFWPRMLSLCHSSGTDGSAGGCSSDTLLQAAHGHTRTLLLARGPLVLWNAMVFSHGCMVALFVEIGTQGCWIILPRQWGNWQHCQKLCKWPSSLQCFHTICCDFYTLILLTSPFQSTSNYCLYAAFGDSFPPYNLSIT